MSNVSAALTAAFQDLDWSQTAVAEMTSINLGQLNRYARGTGVLGDDNLQRLLDFLPDPHRQRLLAAYLRDLIPKGQEHLVTIATNTKAKQEPKVLPDGLDPELARALGRLARKAQIHTDVKDMLLHFTKLICGE